jgi:hypothetical protein
MRLQLKGSNAPVVFRILHNCEGIFRSILEDLLHAVLFLSIPRNYSKNIQLQSTLKQTLLC